MSRRAVQHRAPRMLCLPVQRRGKRTKPESRGAQCNSVLRRLLRAHPSMRRLLDPRLLPPELLGLIFRLGSAPLDSGALPRELLWGIGSAPLDSGALPPELLQGIGSAPLGASPLHRLILHRNYRWTTIFCDSPLPPVKGSRRRSSSSGSRRRSSSKPSRPLDSGLGFLPP